MRWGRRGQPHRRGCRGRRERRRRRRSIDPKRSHGDGIAKKYGWHVGDKIVLQPGIPVYGNQDFPFTIRGIYRSGSSALDNKSKKFHWNNAD